MSENDEEEVMNLPKTVSDEQTSSNGALKRYQDKLVNQYLSIINSFQEVTNNVAKECQQQLQLRMTKYAVESNEIKSKQQVILSTLGSAAFTFDELSEQMKSHGETIVNLSIQLREDALAIYRGYFSKLGPIVEKAFESCELFVSQLPQQYTERLPNEVKRLNVSFLQTKQALIKQLYLVELASREYAANANEEFTKRADEWKINRFNFIVDEAKTQLDLSNSIDFSSIYADFRKDQAQFTYCIKKLISNLVLFSTPDNLVPKELDDWWKEVQEVIDSHKHFISQFIGKFQTKIDERIQENCQLIAKLEKDLPELQPEQESNQALYDLYPMCKITQKYYASFISKLSQYWTMRSDSLLQSFESIRNFLTPIIVHYQNFISETDKNDQFVLSEMEEIANNSVSNINQLNSELDQKTNEILIVASEEDIRNCVSECKDILAKMENEYRDSYDKVMSTFETQPFLVKSLYEKAENELLNDLKMRKTIVSNEVEVLSSNSSLSDVNKKKPTTPSSRRPLKPRIESRTTNTSFEFQAPNGTKYEESESLDLIPQFDDFLDNYTDQAESPSKKGTKSGKSPINAANKNSSTKAKKAGNQANKTPMKAGKLGNKGTRYTLTLEDFDDVETPEFNLVDIVPKADDGSISVWIYLPMNDNISEWGNEFRQSILTSLYNEYQKRSERAKYEDKKADLVAEMNERLRMHAPRQKQIETNIAEKRIHQIETRQQQLEKHFFRCVSNFNKGVDNILTSVDKRKIQIANECNKLLRFIDLLSEQKNLQNFSVVVQNMKIGEKQFLHYFNKQKEDQQSEISKFLDNFKAVNDRFMNTVVMGDKAYSADEQERSNEYFNRMNSQIDEIMNEVQSKVTSSNEEIDALHQSIHDEFESSIVFHKSDVEFVEALQQAQFEAKCRYQDIVYKNRMMEAEIDRLISEVKVNETLDLQQRIIDLVNKIDAMRVSIVKRGIFLSLITSQIIAQPMNFTIDLLEDGIQAQACNAQDSTNLLTKADKKNSKTKTRSKSKTQNADTKLNEKHGKNSKLSEVNQSPGDEKNDQKNGTLSEQFALIGSKLNETVLQLSTDYYNNIKTRQLPITRPSQIPDNQQDCIDQNMKIIKTTTSDFDSIVNESHLHYRTQVQISENVAREMQKKIFSYFTLFYKEQVNKDKSDVEFRFNNNMKEVQYEKELHRNQINAGLSDPNKVDNLNKLIEEEQSRILKEAELIALYNLRIIDCEMQDMKLFTMHLPVLSNKLLRMFDNFIQLDDLTKGRIEGVERKTMRELRKERTRQKAPAISQSSERPFHKRDWQTMNSQMEVLIKFRKDMLDDVQSDLQVLQRAGINVTDSILNDIANGVKIDVLDQKSKSGMQPNQKDGKKKKSIVKPLQGETQSSPSKLPPIDDSNILTQMAVLNSLDTSLNRGLIAERNNSYTSYDKALSKRLRDFSSHVRSLKDETQSFIAYWQRCINELRSKSLSNNFEQVD